jgi:hypothetical protein
VGFAHLILIFFLIAMSTNSVETTSLEWQFFQLQQRISEQWELIGIKLMKNIPDIPLPSWLYSPLAGVIAKVVFWLLVAWLLIWLTWKIQRLVKLYLRGMKPKINQAISPTVKTPFQECSVAHWVAQAQQLQQQENYRGACQCLYQAMLQQLHERGIVPQQASRTDGEYWQIIEKSTQPQPYQQLFRVHQELCFGNLRASFALFESCWQAYREIEKI